MKIGIDLGTTNSALAWIDEREAEDRDFPPVHVFETPQLVAAGRTSKRGARCLRSCFSKKGNRWALMRASKARWCRRGWCTRRKSWLSNPDVDRTAKILPWDSQETGRVLSPVEVSARIHGQVPRGVGPRAWRAAGRAGHRPDGAGFLRRRGARADGDGGERRRIENLTLLEEPAAAFYSWIANNLAHRGKGSSTARPCWSATSAAAPATSA